MQGARERHRLFPPSNEIPLRYSSIPSLLPYIHGRSELRMVFLNLIFHHTILLGLVNQWECAHLCPSALCSAIFTIYELLEAVQFCLKCFFSHMWLRIHSQATVFWGKNTLFQINWFYRRACFLFWYSNCLNNELLLRQKKVGRSEEEIVQYVHIRLYFAKGFCGFYVKGLCSSSLQPKHINLHSMPISGQWSDVYLTWFFIYIPYAMFSIKSGILYWIILLSNKHYIYFGV